MKNSSLNKCKRYSMFYLYTKIKESEIPAFLLHPFIETPVMVHNGVVADIVSNKEVRDNLLSKYSSKIDKATKIEDLFQLVRPQYRIQYFASVNEYLNDKDYAEMLSYSWKSSVLPISDANVKNYRILNFFKKANKKYLMTEKEIEQYEKLPNRITIYRGSENINYEDAFSWTLSKERAHWFATCYNKNGKIIEKEVDKKSIIAYFEYEGENEVIIDYKTLAN